MYSDRKGYRDPENRNREGVEFSGCAYVATAYAVTAALVLWFWGPCA